MRRIGEKISSFISKYSKRERDVLWFLFLTAFIVRVVFLFFNIDLETLAKGDSLQYYTYAQELISQGISIPDISPREYGRWSIFGPGYPFIVSLMIRIFGEGYYWPMVLINAVFTSLTVVVLYRLTMIVTLRKNIALVIAIWAALNLNFIRLNPFLLKESVVYLFLPLSIFLIFKETLKEKISIYLLLSIICFTFLIHSDERYIVYLFVFPFIFMLDFRKSFSRSISRVMLWGLGVLLLMIPWTIRNYQVYDQLVILTERTTTVTSMFVGEDLTLKYEDPKLLNKNIDEAIDSVRNGYTPTSIPKSRITQIQWGIKNGLNPYVFSKSEAYFNAVINFWRPLYLKPIYINNGLRPQQWSMGHNLISMVFYGIFLPFYLLGLFLIIKKRLKKFYILALIPFVQMLIHVALVHVLERYRSPIDFIIVMIGLFFIDYVVNKRGKKSQIANNT